MKCYSLLLIAIALITQCKEKAIEKDMRNNISEEKNISSSKNILQIKGNEILIPNLKLVVYLSKDAIQKLQENKESVVASLLLYGNIEDEDTLPEEIRNEVGPDGLRLGTFQIEEKNISEAISFNFNNLIISKKFYERLANKNIYLNINVFSGRKAFKDNILNVESFDSNISRIFSHGNKIILSGHLIPETRESK
ncbi:hypothetical protein FCL51_15405 [Elizabethkingia anophelis]|uniref:hypothetical protein n=1 Tax=Elizabethkingia anophelis TaxID=1117645 RepID=UPI001365313C|nr:hypothetical protein [Elizabethkingia anophelis]MCT4256520.1 hypothetical protein [Elizabethkingia anophelis]MDV3876152.1 hypothetical protein [Elizabethkingia anophelis]MVW83912.1 hypothetical protein [Elizabethkingia anophelis]HAY3544964.1 hypothetical protein [Elizabethkingia anophelis]